MIPFMQFVEDRMESIPRESGDDPNLIRDDYDGKQYSPRERG